MKNNRIIFNKSTIEEKLTNKPIFKIQNSAENINSTYLHVSEIFLCTFAHFLGRDYLHQLSHLISLLKDVLFSVIRGRKNML